MKVRQQCDIRKCVHRDHCERYVDLHYEFSETRKTSFKPGVVQEHMTSDGIIMGTCLSYETGGLNDA